MFFILNTLYIYIYIYTYPTGLDFYDMTNYQGPLPSKKRFSKQDFLKALQITMIANG